MSVKQGFTIIIIGISLQLRSELDAMTDSVLPSDIDEQWQTLITKIDKKVNLEVEAGMGKRNCVIC